MLTKAVTKVCMLKTSLWVVFLLVKTKNITEKYHKVHLNKYFVFTKDNEKININLTIDPDLHFYIAKILFRWSIRKWFNYFYYYCYYYFRTFVLFNQYFSLVFNAFSAQSEFLRCFREDWKYYELSMTINCWWLRQVENKFYENFSFFSWAFDKK